MSSTPTLIPEKLLNTSDLARITGAHLNTVHNWIHSGAVPRPIKIGRRFYWRPEQIRDFISARREGGAS